MEYDYTISTFHYLCNTQDLDVLCNTYNKKKCSDRDGVLDGNTLRWVSEKQAQRLQSLGAEYIGGFNTYNYESNLSQVLQGSIIDINWQNYVLLQIHWGAEVRWWYTDAKMFKLENEYMPPEDVYWKVDWKPVSNMYDGTRLRYNMEDSDDKLHEQEIDGFTLDSVAELHLAGY